MTVRYHCDGPDCERTMGRSDKRIAATIEPHEFKEPEMDDDGQYRATVDIYVGDGDLHFCSNACLASWGMTQHIDQGPL